MTRRGWAVAGAAGAISVGLHAGGLIALEAEPPETLAGGPSQLAMIGNSFEDAVSGSVTGTARPERIAAVETLTAAEPVAEPALARTVRPSANAAPRAEAAPQASMPSAAPAQAAPAPPVASAPAATAAAVASVAPVASTRVAALAPTRPARAPAPAASSVPEASPPATPDALTARDGPIAQAPDADTPRPEPRRARAPEAPPIQVPAAPRRPAAAPQGNAAQTASAGDRQGAAPGTARRTQQGTAGQSSSDGRAAAEYPQRVNRHLSRLSRPNTRFDGVAVVAFTIAGDGGLAGLSVARSSGNAEFDRLALAHIRRAVPFPPPPGDAQRSYNVTVRGR